jgi:Plasmid pRiA4b ORF-3-like protein
VPRPPFSRGLTVADRSKNRGAADVQLRIELLRIAPHVWRRVIVPQTVTLAKLHIVLQAAMGWTDSHLHEYEIANKRYGIEDPDLPSSVPIFDERRERLKSVIEDHVGGFTYLYDFGDRWEHQVTIEELVASEVSRQPIVCTAGESACPPEDVGGEPGYETFLAAITDAHNKRHVELKEWIGYPFDPHALDLNAVNQRLARIKP